MSIRIYYSANEPGIRLVSEADHLSALQAQAQTGGTELRDAAEKVALGFDDKFVSPADYRELLNKLRTALSTHPAPEGLREAVEEVCKVLDHLQTGRYHSGPVMEIKDYQTIASAQSDKLKSALSSQPKQAGGAELAEVKEAHKELKLWYGAVTPFETHATKSEIAKAQARLDAAIKALSAHSTKGE